MVKLAFNNCNAVNNGVFLNWYCLVFHSKGKKMKKKNSECIGMIKPKSPRTRISAAY